MASVGKTSVAVHGLSKSYSIAHKHQRATTMAEAVMNRLRRPMQKAQKEIFWALRAISFEIREGEAVGFIGRNGAGKSTLLKVLSRITGPTTGEVQLYGPVGSLLEVGTGFHPELTGRENIYLNGSILGMRRRQIDKQFDAIVEFSEVERFLDTPVKRYSSGMYVRLAFAVAAHLNPEILIIDEVLAVGDANFQKKCLAKMSEIASQEGRTVLFVSHNMAAIQTLCQRAFWLEKGTLRDQGAAKDVVPRYLKTAFAPQQDRSWDDLETAPGNAKVRLRRATVRPDSPSSQTTITTRTPLLMEFEYWNLSHGAHLNLSVVVQNEEGTPIFNTVPSEEPRWHGRPFPAGLFRSVIQIPGDLLNTGTHRVLVYIVEDQSVVLSRLEDILVFDVHKAPDEQIGCAENWEGAVRPRLQWTTELVEPGVPSFAAA
jgi:lipopolysaccharide transport system ATP-binding protein